MKLSLLEDELVDKDYFRKMLIFDENVEWENK
jgi:hypothetical protein